MQVIKFGGTSLKNAESINNVCNIIYQKTKQGHVTVVLSAIAGVTNSLQEIINLAASASSYQTNLEQLFSLHHSIIKELYIYNPDIDIDSLNNYIEKIHKSLTDKLSGIDLLGECPDKIYCEILAFGEQLSTFIVYNKLKTNIPELELLDAKKLIKTKGTPSEGIPLLDEIKANFAELKQDKSYVISGFISTDKQGHTNLLGRDGSDFTASLVAMALNANHCEIWTDVDGVFTADPNQVKGAKLVKEISYAEAMEMSFYGGNILHPKTTTILKSTNIPIYIKNTFNPDGPGTKICHETSEKNGDLIRAVTSMNRIGLVNVYGSGMRGVAGIASHVFNAVSKCGASIVLISQASSEYSICFAILEKDANLVSQTLHEELALELDANIIEDIEITLNQSILCIVGDKMRTRYGIAGTFFSSLANYGVNINAIAQGSSERCVSAVVDGHDIKKALTAVHNSFFSSLKTIKLYITGVGSVGSELIEQINSQQDELLSNNLEIKVCSISNSKKCLYNDNGLDLNNWQEQLNNSKLDSSIITLLEQVKQDKPINGALIDCTSSDLIAGAYDEIFHSGLHIVTANKKANSDDFEYYSKLRKTQDKFKRLFLYETNVGAGLPVIDTFKGLMKSGDVLHDFSGILSGSLSYIFGALEDGMLFSEAVISARDKKFTEPDPRDDLSGMDVARKVLILAREAGLTLEIDNIKIESIYPSDFDESGTIDNFLNKIQKLDQQFKNKVEALAKQNKVLRYIGEINNGVCTVGLKEVDAKDPLYQIKNGENAFAFLTKHYSPIPLVVRGYGAGVSVTASGLFSDILRLANLR